MGCLNLAPYISNCYWFRSGFLSFILAVFVGWHITSIIFTQFFCVWVVTTLTDWLLCNVMDVEKGCLRWNTLLGKLIYQQHRVARLIIGLNLYFAFKCGHGHKNYSGKWHFSHLCFIKLNLISKTIQLWSLFICTSLTPVIILKLQLNWQCSSRGLFWFWFWFFFWMMHKAEEHLSCSPTGPSNCISLYCLLLSHNSYDRGFFLVFGTIISQLSFLKGYRRKVRQTFLFKGKGKRPFKLNTCERENVKKLDREKFRQGISP